MKNFLKLSFITAAITLSNAVFAQEDKPAKGIVQPVTSQTLNVEKALDTQSAAPATATIRKRVFSLEKEGSAATTNALSSESINAAPAPKNE